MSARYCFIVGTGRSGTHFLTSLMLSHPRIEDTLSGKENKAVLQRATRAVLANRLAAPLRNILYYRLSKLKVGSKVFLDQSHPNLHFVEHLDRHLAGSRFIALWRDTRAVVASMLLHKGVLSWYAEADKLPFPNHFLGPVPREIFFSLSDAEKCALRVVHHKNVIASLSRATIAAFKVQCYEDFAGDLLSEANALFAFCDLPPLGSLPIEFKAESLEKWKHQLSKEQVRAIDDIEARFATYN